MTNLANLSISDLDAMLVKALGFSWIAEVGGIDNILNFYSDEEIRQEVANLLECVA